ncbi:MAG TPA: YggS family pyridoxal phosphate-dependent enzyme [Chitinophagales bacterium]
MKNEILEQLIQETKSKNARLIAVSKTKSAPEILHLYNQGQRLFGENKVQEMTEKQGILPLDIEWHLIGHLQRNKVKFIAPFVGMIHSVDSEKLLAEINKEAMKNERIIPCLLQIHIANEETKFGFSSDEVIYFLTQTNLEKYPNVAICGLMGMATNTDDTKKIASEFASLKRLFDEIKTKFFAQKLHFKELSMGMSSDYKIALENGATLIRVGSLLFGNRQ